MKTRTDFVSNSSSSSFVVACKKEFLKDITKDLARACMNKRDKCHDKELGKNNQCILDFCLKTFQLVFLGELLLETKEETYSLDYFKRIWAIPSKNMPTAYAEEAWKRYKNIVERVKSGKEKDSWAKKAYDLDEYDAETDTAKHFEKIYAKDIVVSNNTMKSDFNRYHYSNGPDSEETIKGRVQRIIDFAKDKVKRDSCEAEDCFEAVDIYQITKDTIDNTRNLIAQGYKVELGEWEDLDRLDAKLDSGESIFRVRIAHLGDGYGDFYIYCEDGADGIDGVSGIEVLTSDSL